MKKLLFTMAIGLITISCQQEDSRLVETANTSAIILSPEEYASIAPKNSKELTSDEVLNVLQQFQSDLEKKNQTKSYRPISYKIKEKYYIDLNNTERTTPTRSATNTSIPIYTITLDNQDKKGYAVISADTRYPKVIAYIPQGDIDKESFIQSGADAFLALSKQSACENIISCDLLKDSLEKQTIAKICQKLNLGKDEVSFDKIKDRIKIQQTKTKAVQPSGTPQGEFGPFIKTNWNQLVPYNLQLEMKNAYMHANAGCANAALALILSWIQPVMQVKNNTGNYISIDWPYLTSEKDIKWNIINPNDPTNSPKAKVDMVGYLYKNIYEGTQSKIIESSGQTNTPTANFEAYLKKYATFSSQKKFESAAAKKTIDNAKVVAVLGEKSNGGAHIWLLDGILICSKNTRELVKNFNVYFHANFGWGDENSGYYLINENLSVDFIISDGNRYSNLRMYTDIFKK